MGKGSNQRPKAVDEQTFESNWDRIFASFRQAQSEVAERMDGFLNTEKGDEQNA